MSMNTSIYNRQWDVGSFTDSTKKPYKVSERRDGRWECSCPAWTRHTPRTDCKHIVKVKKASYFSPQNPVFVAAPPVESQPTVMALVSSPQGCAVIIEGYAIRRRALDDTLTDADDATTARRSHREL
jgi:hypothetical protein